jgi:hypothetical protein
MLFVWWLIGVLVSLGFAWLCGSIAAGKNRSSVIYGVLGFFFSIITLIVVLVLPSREA